MPMYGTVLTGTNGISSWLQLAQYCAGCKYCLASYFSTWDIPLNIKIYNMYMCLKVKLTNFSNTWIFSLSGIAFI